MKKQKNSLQEILSLGFLSFFGTGYAPKAPGTVGSLATIPLILLLDFLNFNLFFLILLISFTTLIACIIAENVQKQKGLHDPGWIVIDEVIGMLITWCFLFPSVEPIDLALIFIFFRVFDIFKIWPATFFDKRVKHGSGTILDDVISAFYAGFACLLCKYLLSYY
jgi:phosphatidylglycerophosphatase A